VFMLPLLTTVFLGVHYYKVVLHGASLPPRSEEVGQDTAKRIPADKRVYFIPDIATSELMWFGAATFLMVVVCIWFFHAPLEHHADPGVTPLHTTAPWYFLWLQGLLKLGDKTLMGVILPGVLLSLFFVFPYLDTTPSRRYAHRKLALSLSMGFITAMLVLTYMGTPKYGVASSGDVEVVQELAPVEGVGPLRAVPFEEFKAGTYCTDDLYNVHQLKLAELTAPSAVLPILLPVTFGTTVTCQAVPRVGEFAAVMEDYAAGMKSYAESMPNGIGLLTVTDNEVTGDAATDLKRLDIKVMWNAPELDKNRNVVHNDDGSVKVQLTSQAVLNADGTPKLDANNAPVTNQVPIVNTNGKTIFVNRASEYHNTGG